jgi:hypothetical protein
MKEYLEERGWGTWYHPNYWVHKKVIANPEVQDYTNYGMTLEEAYRFETENHPKIPPLGIFRALSYV